MADGGEWRGEWSFRFLPIVQIEVRTAMSGPNTSRRSMRVSLVLWQAHGEVHDDSKCQVSQKLAWDQPPPHLSRREIVKRKQGLLAVPQLAASRMSLAKNCRVVACGAD